MNTPTGPATATGQCVNVAQALDNSIYTVVLKDSGGLSTRGYPLTLPKQPYSYSASGAAMFPTFTAITIGGQPITPSTVIANSNVAISLTMPSGVTARHLNVWANSEVSLRLFPGEVHTLMGQNGAGKSTLIKVLTGLYTPDSGSITLAGRAIQPRSTQDAQALGISTVYQEVNLCPNLSVAENIFIGRYPASASAPSTGAPCRPRPRGCWRRWTSPSM